MPRDTLGNPSELTLSDLIFLVSLLTTGPNKSSYLVLIGIKALPSRCFQPKRAPCLGRAMKCRHLAVTSPAESSLWR